MAQPLPKDLRERAYQAWEDGDPITEVADTFRIGTATVKRWVRRKQETGGLDPAPRRHGPQPFASEERIAKLLALLAERNDWTQQELADAWGERCGAAVSADTVGRALVKLGYSRKKRRSTQWSATRHASRNSTPSIWSG